MRKLWTIALSAAPIMQGFLGAALLALILYCGLWVRDRCNEFVVMRTVVGQLIDNSNKERAKQDAQKAEKP